MLIQGKHITGMYPFSKDLPYTSGDFVVYKECIYICTAKNPTDKENFTVTGKIPETDTDNYKLYLSDRIATFEEFQEYIKNPEEVEDKSISCDVLLKTLNQYLMGVNEKGIIDQEVKYTGSDIEISEEIKKLVTGQTKDNILQKILTSPNINFASYKISKDLPEIKNLFPEYPKVVGEEENSYKLLRQYTYKSGENTLIRVQEIIDPIGSIQFFRYTKGDFSTVSEWRRSFIGDNYRDEIDYVKLRFTKLVEELEEEKASLRNNFRQYYIDIVKSNTVILQCNNPGEKGYVKVLNFLEPCVVDIIVRAGRETWTLTIDLSDSFGDMSITTYKVSGTDLLIQLSEVSEKSISINLQSVEGVISNIIGRERL